MRLWTLHPAYLDRQGLTALWREGLLAQAVLAGRTQGYTRHPQLDRFRGERAIERVGAYLRAVAEEAAGRGYRYDVARIDHRAAETVGWVNVTSGQVAFEWAHLMTKLEGRSPELARRWVDEETERHGIRVHPLFRVTPGPIADWERP